MIRPVAFALVVLAGAAIGHAASGPPRTVAIVAVGQRPADLATGFVVAPGRVVTVAHAVERRAAVTIRGADGVALRASVVRRDEASDLALLAVAGLVTGRRPAALLADDAASGVLVRRGSGRAVVAARLVRRADARVRNPDGRVLARRPVLELRVAGIRAGDSGAPVLDAHGSVLGVVFARSHRRGDVAWAVDMRALASLLR